MKKTDMTEVMRLADDNHDPKSNTVGPAQPKNISDFRYLGGCLTKIWSPDKEVTYRNERATADFGSLRKKVFS